VTFERLPETDREAAQLLVDAGFEFSWVIPQEPGDDCLGGQFWRIQEGKSDAIHRDGNLRSPRWCACVKANQPIEQSCGSLAEAAKVFGVA